MLVTILVTCSHQQAHVLTDIQSESAFQPKVEEKKKKTKVQVGEFKWRPEFSDQVLQAETKVVTMQDSGFC